MSNSLWFPPGNVNYDRPILAKIRELHLELIMEKWEGCCFCLIPGHVGIRENSAADSAAKDVLDSDISDEFIPFLDFKPTDATCE